MRNPVWTVGPLIGLTWIGACAAPRAATSKIEDAEERLHLRAPEAALVAEALELAQLERLGIELPDEVAVGSEAFWHAAAYQYSPSVREARSRALRMLAMEPSAGAPGPVTWRLTDHEFGGDDTLAETAFLFDVLGGLGAGPSAAKQQVARAESLDAVAKFEEALWRARFEVDRARVKLAAAAELADGLASLAEEYEEDLPRIEILVEHDRMSTAVADSARARLDGILAMERSARSDEASLERALTMASGLLELPEVTWPEVGPTPAQPGPHPRLRRAQLAVALEEARLRAVAARAWPGLSFGPHLGFPSGELEDPRVGGLLSLRLPWPSSYEGPLEAAAVARDRSLERYDETFLELRAALAAALEQIEHAKRRSDHTLTVYQATQGMCAATRAQFRVGRAEAMDWAQGFGRRADAWKAHVIARRDLVLARLDALEAAGPKGGAR